MTATIRQGDVLLVPVAKIPARAATVSPQHGRLIVALGEATGHHHSFPHRRGAALFRDDAAGGALYVSLDEATPLEHQEHSALQLAPGTYRVAIQRTFQAGMARRVED